MTSPSTGDAYLDLAIAALRRRRWPLSTKEILSDAKTLGFMPSHLRGATPHKTLNARISEHIREFRDKSIIYRVAPATYFLRELKDTANIPGRFRKEYHGILRYKQVRHENVLVIRKSAIQELGISGFSPFVDTLFSLGTDSLRFIDRRDSRSLAGHKKLISYTVLVRNGVVLSYSRGHFTTVPKDLKGARSIGFGGHINDDDFDLFASGSGAFVQSAARELHEELGINDILEGETSAPRNLKLLGLLNIDDTAEAMQNMAVVSAYRPAFGARIEKQEMSINNIAWIDPFSELQLEQFEPWSAYLINGMREGTVDVTAPFRGINW